MTTYTLTNVLAKNAFPAWLQAIPLALGVTLGLFVLMQRLISVNYPTIDETPPVNLPKVVWEEPNPVTVINKKIEKPTPPQIDPPTPAKPEAIDEFSSVQIPKVAVFKEVRVGGMADYRMPVPQIMVSPKYPQSALNRQLEGYVDVKFDIATSGATENITVLAAVPQGVFESSAMDAVSRWRYLPQLNEGKPVPFRGMTQRLRFEMGK